MREVPSRKAKPVVDLSSGGKAPVRRISVPIAEGQLDGIGTGDTGAEGSKALILAANASRLRRSFHSWVDGDPFLWTDGAFDADWAHGCAKPYYWGVSGRPTFVPNTDPVDSVLVRGVMTKGTPQVNIQLPCRKCPACQKSRKRLWIARAINEVLKAPRTWFFTGTFREKPEGEEPVVKEYQRFMKRFRKKHNVRYLAVLERGERNGRLHVHMLIHGDVKYRDIAPHWTAGFYQIKEVKAQWDDKGRLDDDSARQVFYVAGYVTGDISFRIRNSVRYGRITPTQRRDALLQKLRRAGLSPLSSEAEAATPTPQTLGDTAPSWGATSASSLE